MSTTIESSDSEQYLDYDDYVDFQLDKTRAHIRGTDVLTAVVGVGTLTLGYLLAFVVFDQWVIPGGFGYATRVAMWSIVGVIAIGWLLWKVAIPQFKQVNRLFAARAIERSEPELKSTLLNLVDLERSGNAAAEPIRNTMERRAAVKLSGMNVEQAVDRRFLTRLSYALLAIVVVSCLYWVLSPKQISSSLWRAVLPTADVTVSTRTRIVDVKPGKIEILVGSQLEVIAELEGEIPEKVTLFYTSSDGSSGEATMRKVETGTNQFRGMILGSNGRGLRQDLQYYVTAGDGDSRDFRTWRREGETAYYLSGGREYRREDDKVKGELVPDRPDKFLYEGVFSVSVLQPPRATVSKVSYEFPKYMRLPARTQPVGHVDGWEGAKVTWTADTNMPVVSAVMQFSDDETFTTKAEELIMRKISDLAWSADLTLKFRTDGTAAKFYRVHVRKKKGETDPEPTVYGFKIRPDLPPVVEQISPRTDLVRPANALVLLLVRARDPDFMLRSVHLRVQKDGEPIELSNNVLFEGEQQSYQGTFEFDLAPLNLKPDDVITYWIEARDNNPRGRSGHNQPGLKIRIAKPADPEEVKKQRDRDKQRNDDELEREKQENNDENDPDQEQKAGEDTGDQGSKGEKKKQSKSKPGDGDDPPKSKPQSGEKGKKPQDGTKGEPSDDGNGKSKPDGLKNDGSDDDRALKKAFEKFKKDQDKKKGDPKKPRDDEGQSKSKPEPGEKQKPNDGSKTNTPKPGDEKKTKPKSDGSKKPEGGTEKKSKPGEKQPSDTEKKKQPGGGTAKPEAGTGEDSKKPPEGVKPTGTDKKPGEKPEPDDGDGGNKPGTKPGPGSKDPKDPPDGPERPGDPKKKAIKKKAKGDETGNATPSKDPTDDPTPAKNKLDRKPDAKSDPRTSPNKTDEKPPTDTKKFKGKPDPNDPTRKKKTGTRKKEVPDGTDPKGNPKKAPRDREPGDPKGKPKEKLPGDNGNKNPNSDPTGTQNDNGSGKSGEKRPKQPGDSPSKSKPGAGKKKEKGRKPGEGKAGKEKGPKSDKTGNKGGGKPSEKKPGEKQRNGGGGTSGDGNNDGDGADSAAQRAEEANLDYGKEAADLVLRRLEKDLKRGEVDENLLKELGWTQEDTRRFAERLRNRLEPATSDATPQERARRRQFEETLKSLNLKSVGSKRTGEGVRRSGDPAGSFGGKRLPVPPEYREAYDAYTRSLAKRRKAAAKPKE
jgi:hypothetical protein